MKAEVFFAWAFRGSGEAELPRKVEFLLCVISGVDAYERCSEGLI